MNSRRGGTNKYKYNTLGGALMDSAGGGEEIWEALAAPKSLQEVRNRKRDQCAARDVFRGMYDAIDVTVEKQWSNVVILYSFITFASTWTLGIE